MRIEKQHPGMEELLVLAETREYTPHLQSCPECAAEYGRLREALAGEPDSLPALPAVRPVAAAVSRFLGTFFGAGVLDDPVFAAAHPRFCAFLGLEPGLNLARRCFEDREV